jgi:hypothetical protein
VLPLFLFNSIGFPSFGTYIIPCVMLRYRTSAFDAVLLNDLRSINLYLSNFIKYEYVLAAFLHGLFLNPEDRGDKFL